jgi:large subunit ribosomal protein L7/L12
VPSVVKEAANKAEAEGIKKQLEEAGAAVELK